ncbi:MAG: hypothetical protein KIT84_30480 [Labilithrix sp.]|nr:hypothetical protein [Labilithrix sp.]MCW5815393.1 hypothetical protein [Labilithrix sp.]
MDSPSCDVDRRTPKRKARGFTFDEDPASRELFEAGLVRLTLPPGGAVVLIASDSPYLEQVIERASTLDVASAKLNVATVEDLLLLKLEANRPIDLDDAIAIKDAYEHDLDRTYLAAQGDALGLRGPLENLLGPL